MELVTIQVGKNGFSEELIADVNKHLKKRKNVKLKLLNGFLDSMDIDRKMAFNQFKELGFDKYSLKLVGKVIFVENK